MRMLVLGAGLQGSACAFDLLRNPAVEHVTLADLRIGALPAFLQPHAGGRLSTAELDVRNHDAVRTLMRQCTAVCSAIPYYFNFPLAQLAVECGVHFTDLGGNTEIVLQQKGLEADAEAKGVSIVPDTGLAPGMVNVLAQFGISQLDTVDSVKLFVGGLPQNPLPPLNYQIVYSLEGVVDYYTTESLVVRGGRRTTVAALSEIEMVRFPEPLGELEAFHTAGGLSTMVFRYEGKIPNMEYKTLRYPGHANIMEAIRDLGLLSLDPVDVKGQQVVPRDVFVKVAGAKLRKPGGKDLVALRVVVTGKKDGQAAERAWQMIASYDEANGLTAMMQTTGFTLSITSQLQATGVIRPGVHTPDECIPAERYLAMLAERGIVVEAMQ
jgi:lysine 6-dehydrogenase